MRKLKNGLVAILAIVGTVYLSGCAGVKIDKDSVARDLTIMADNIDKAVSATQDCEQYRAMAMGASVGLRSLADRVRQ